MNRKRANQFALWMPLILVLFLLTSLAAHAGADDGPGITRVTPDETPTATATATPTATEIYCPSATPEVIWVDPVTSPTNLFTQTITVRLGNADLVNVIAPSGVFTARGDIGYDSPALVPITLLTDTVNNLAVAGRVMPWGFGPCRYDGYWLSVAWDRYGAPLAIVQTTVATPVPGNDDRFYVPVVTAQHKDRP